MPRMMRLQADFHKRLLVRIHPKILWSRKTTNPHHALSLRKKAQIMLSRGKRTA